MAFLKKLLILLMLLVGLALGIWFSIDNPQKVTVTLLGFPLPAVSLGVMIFGVFALGTALGYVISLWPVLGLKNHNLSLKRKLKRRDKELERLRRVPASKSVSGRAAAESR